MASSKTLDLLVKVRLGDEQAKEQVVKDNLGLVWSIVHRFKNSYYDKEDLFQIGCIGLIILILHTMFNFQHMLFLLLWEKLSAILEMMEQLKFLVL